VLSAALAVVCLECPGALACPGPFAHTSVFYGFADLAAGVDAPVIVDVEITAVSDTDPHWAGVDRSHSVGFARIRRVVKGSIDGDSIRVLVYPSSCGPYDFDGGRSGLVAGTLRRNWEGKLELIAKQHTPHLR
jgi:hypothetical protein